MYKRQPPPFAPPPRGAADAARWSTAPRAWLDAYAKPPRHSTARDPALERLRERARNATAASLMRARGAEELGDDACASKKPLASRPLVGDEA